MTELAAYTSLLLAVVDPDGAAISAMTQGPIDGWTPIDATPAHALWMSTSGVVHLWKLDERGNRIGDKQHGPFPGWTPVGMTDDHVLWRSTDGRASLWVIDAEGNQLSYKEHGPYPGWTPINCSDGHLLWRHSDGRASLWQVDAQGNHLGYKEHGPYPGWIPVHYAEGRLLWRHTNGSASLWVVDASGAHVSYREHGPIPGCLPVRADATTMVWRGVGGPTQVWTIGDDLAQIRAHEYAGAGALVVQRTQAAAVSVTADAIKMAKTTVSPTRPTPTIAYIAVAEPIASVWQSTGGASGPLGAARSAASLADDGETLAQQFTVGGIAHHAGLGATIFRSDRLYGDWRHWSGMVGAPPTGDFAAGTARLGCDRGPLLCSPAGYYFPVQGWSYLSLYRNGDAAVGRPLGPSVAEPGGYTRQHFERGDIIALDDNAAFLPSAFVAAWAAAGGAQGPLGLPVADLAQFQSGGAVVRFEGGALIEGPAGVVALPKEWLTAWETRLGGPGSAYGLPLSGVQTSPGGAAWIDFQGGCLILTSAKAWLAPRSLKVKVLRFGAYGDDGGAGNQDLYVRVDITPSTGGAVQLRLPEGAGVYTNADVEVNCDIFELPAVRGGLVLDLRFMGWDDDSGNVFGGDDDRLGEISHSLTIDQLWGSLNPGNHRNGDFSVEYAVQLELPYDPGKFRQDMFWTFRNFKTPDLSFDQLARAFSDIETDETTGWNIYHHAFHLAVRSRAADGNCFGMCLESLYAQLGRSLYRPPLSIYGPQPTTKECLVPTPGVDDAIIDQINVRHLYQFGAEQMTWYLIYSIMQEDFRGETIFAFSKHLHDRNTHPLFYVYTDKVFGSGHVVRPYAWDPNGRWIRVANPNTPHPHFPDDHAWNVIRIDPAAGTWTLDSRDDKGNGSFYSNSTGGRIAAVPSTYVLEAPRVPTLAQLVQFGIALLFLKFGSADVEQVTDDVGRTLFAEGLGGPHRRWQDLRERSARLPNFLPVPPLGGDPLAIDPQFLADAEASRYQCFVGRGRPPRLSYRVLGRGGDVQLLHLGGRLSAIVDYRSAASERDEFTVLDGGAASPALVVKASGARRFDAKIGRDRRIWRLRDLALAGPSEVQIDLRDSGRAIAIRSAGSPVAFDLERLVGHQFVACGDRSDLSLGPAQQLEIREEATNVLSASLIDRNSLTQLRKWTL